MSFLTYSIINDAVTPHAGVWIETSLNLIIMQKKNWSRLMQACGLKQGYFMKVRHNIKVTPHAGVWIETRLVCSATANGASHASCRRVD